MKFTQDHGGLVQMEKNDFSTGANYEQACLSVIICRELMW